MSHVAFIQLSCASQLGYPSIYPDTVVFQRLNALHDESMMMMMMLLLLTATASSQSQT